MHMRHALRMALVIAIAFAGCDKAERQAAADGQGEETAMSEQLQYGFRYDPVEAIGAADGLEAALVRTLLLKMPRPGDATAIEAHFAEIFATQNNDGSFPHEEGWEPRRATALTVLELLGKGCSPDRPEVQRAVAFLEAALDELSPDALPEDGPGDAVQALCMLGRADHPVAKAWLESLAAEMPELWGKGCPGTPFAQLLDLWAGREVADVDDAIKATLAWADEAIAEPGCSSKLALCSSWSMVNVLGQIDHPAATRLARRLAPMLVRAQQTDGRWREGHGGDETFGVLRFLITHGRLDELRSLPPMPADWKVVRALPIPGGRAGNICALDGKLWVLNTAERAIIEISPEDGRVLNRLQLELIPGMNHFTLARGDGVFYVSSFGEKEVRQDTIHEIDAVTGEVLREFPLPTATDVTGATCVRGKIYACDGWQGGVWVIDPNDPEAEPYQTYELVAAGMPDYMASDGETIWAVGFMAPSLVKSTPDGEMLDWAERPFAFQPLAWDGQNLWALDPGNKRICLIERADPAEAPSMDVTQKLVQAEPAFDIPRMDGAVAGEQQSFVVDLLSPIYERQESDDFDASFTLGWTEDALVVIARVRNDSFVAAEDLKMLWGNRADSVLLYVKSPGGELLRVVVEPGMTDDQPTPRIMREPQAMSSEIAAVRRKLDDGYDLNLVVPWDVIGIDAAEGQELRVQLIALDVDGSGEEMELHGLMWYPATGTPEDPWKSYRVRLAQMASPAPAALVMPTKNAHGLVDSIRVSARADRVGQMAAIGSAEVAMVGDGSGMAVAWLPLRADTEWPLTVTVDGE
ncbi:MAG: hypothetical protein ACYTFO_05150, partial [Planctomycetota bacterium]